MFTVYKKEVNVGGRILTLETGKIARQADGSVVATYGGTVVMANVTFAKSQKEGVDFFPLTVNYQEKFYAAGRIPGGFNKREGRPSERETLTCRLIDRPIRPLFPKAFRNETQIALTVLAMDGVNNPEMVSMVAASAALSISGIPFLGPIAGVRVGYIDGEYIINPTEEQQAESLLELSVAGTKEGVMMVESEAAELSEEVMLGAVVAGHEASKPIIEAIEELAAAASKPAYEMPEVEDTSALAKELQDAFAADINAAYAIKEKQERRNKLDAIKEAAVAKFVENPEENGALVDKVKSLIKSAEGEVLRSAVLNTHKRIDGRGLEDIRPILCEVDVLPGVHGSALFTRGETQALVVATLGTGKSDQLIDQPEGEYFDSFMLHYNFPPYSVGEVGRMGSPGRREIGHGKLARRAVQRMLPSKEDFGYTIRLVSEITESNGSSSMATVCGSSMAMMAAGVPLARPVSGIAMGLVKEGDKYAVLSDIMGDEDHLGDMDFKVAGTSEGITALQMDIKITSITPEIMKEALAQANGGRMHILGKMAQAVEASRSEVSEYAPQMEIFQIDKEKIRDVIGTGGKVIRELIETTGCTIDIEDDGTVKVAAVSRTDLQKGVQAIKDIVAEPEVGVEYTGEITRIADFGAFVKFMPNREGLLHISEIVPMRLNNVSDALAEGETVTVKVLSVEGNGKVRLSIKEVEQAGAVAERIAGLVAANDARKAEKAAKEAAE